ncbi:LolA family protein [Microlunatus ginsengisoli]|uniref:Outer membrane lipoprotein carrier protein LolA n=1 Tax=Microlunatus ginsengisoli TaxID=363863 RepID=A0ABP6ZUY5_9ACTN
MRIFQSHPALRWAVPAIVVGVVGGTSLIAVSASADAALPDETPQQLLVDLQNSHVDSFSGTVVQTSDLGLPQLPGIGGDYDTSLTSLISGTHTLQVWSSGEDKQRLAIHGTLGETDIIRNGTDVWNWSSRDNAATHTKLSSDTAEPEHAVPSDAPKTPQEAAAKVLDAIEPTTTVSTNPAVKVAGRDAYALVLEPKDSGSLIGQVRIAIDGEKKVPLSVKVIATDGTTVFETAFSSIDFGTPDDANFTFNAPPGTKVTEEKPPTVDKDKVAERKAQAEKDATAAQKDTTVVGSGWSTVVVGKADLSKASTEDSTHSGERGGAASMQQILNALPKVSGSWGSGRLLASKAFSVVITDDGRFAAGAVAPETLYKALS